MPNLIQRFAQLITKHFSVTVSHAMFFSGLSSVVYGVGLENYHMAARFVIGGLVLVLIAFLMQKPAPPRLQ